ncbi:hypothetical protein M422DRAFT_220506 [Sphaerobolus stellatus SS14]|nr:hypothetical protein M422DRAFT_220506 [Sphaerobolus stellatus SS14]
MTRHEEILAADLQDQVAITKEFVGENEKDEKYASSSDEKHDPNKLEASIDPATLDYEDKLYDEHGKEKVLETAEDFATALVSLDDDPTLPIHTFRTWFIGIGLAVFGAVLAMLFQFRPQVIDVSALFLQLIAYMLGILLQTFIPGPGSRFHTGSRFWNFMNPGPFNIKEHVASQIMANTASVAATACFVFASDDLFYNIQVNAGNAIFTLLASQLVGYGFAGMFRSFLVYPTAMLFPQNLIYVNLFDVLHRSKGSLLQGKRLRFFWIVTAAVFVYEWLPEYIAPLLGSINIVCLAVRKSDWVSFIFGGANGNEGMGLLGFGVDWANITSAPFYIPLATQISQYVGWAMNYLILPLVYANDVWHSKNFPFISQNLFYENGTIYDQNLILNSDFSLNRTAFEFYGQPWQSGSSIIYNIGVSLAIGATFVHVALWYGKDIWTAFIKYLRGDPVFDAHYERMKIYPEVPMYWYAGITLGAFVVAMVCAYTEHSQLPWYALIVALVFSVLVLPFYGAMLAIAGWAPPISQLFLMLGAAVIPGSSQANMYFELYSYRSLKQAAFMLSDLKLGQYTKLPPRVTFIVQIAGTVVGALINYVIMQTVVTNERDILLSNEGTRVWSGQQIQSFNANAVTWGALGKELYGPKGPYFIVPISIVIGLALPIVPWLLYKKFGWKWLTYMNTAVLAYNIGDLAGGTNGYINTWMAIGLTSHFYIRKYRAGWFRKYNYLLGAAIDGGAQIFVFIFSFSLAGAGGKAIAFPEWALNPSGNSDYCKVTG